MIWYSRSIDRLVFFFFKQKTAYEIKECDWSSDVCSSDLHKFRFMNNVPLNESNKDVKVNFLDYCEIDGRTGKTKYFSWITDIEVTKENSYKLMRSGRARWKIENETFNTLTNQEYNLKHNFGLGDRKSTRLNSSHIPLSRMPSSA